MCGICGYVGTHRPELLAPMTQVMAHRGPDDVGTWHDPRQRVGLGHRRLSIIDLSADGHQPMANEDKTIWITYNGELYDFEQHRGWLEARGHVFRSRTDTEVLVHLYEEEGIDFLQRLNGIFAFALWDGRDASLLLARDHAGIKPLYYWQSGESLYFASEIKALLRIPEMPARLRLESIPEYLTFLWVPGGHTMLADVRKVEPGHYLLWRDGHVRQRQWFSIRYEPQHGVSDREWVGRVHDCLVGTIRRQMVSDRPLGAFLSGGLDSSSIVACMRHLFPDREINCYTTKMEPADLDRSSEIDDYPYAQRVAELLGVRLTSFLLQPSLLSLLPKMVWHLDEPDADPAVFPSYLIAKAAREDGSVVLLSGTGGDEVFFGYRSHRALHLYRRLRWLRAWPFRPAASAMTSAGAMLFGAKDRLVRRCRKFSRGLFKDGLARHIELVDWSNPLTRSLILHPDLARAVGGPEQVPECMNRYWDGFRGEGQINQHTHMLVNTFLAAHNFLYVDKSSMATSLEVRVPFMDLELMRLAAEMPERMKLRGSRTKYVLKEAMRRYLPANVLYRPKTGFGCPLRRWIGGDLKPVIEQLLHPRVVRDRGIFVPEAVSRILKEDSENREDHSFLIYAMMFLEVWMRTFIDRRAEQVTL